MEYEALATRIQSRMLSAPTANHLRDVLVDALVARNVMQDEASFSQEVMHFLCQAYSLALKNQSAAEDIQLELLPLDKAQEIFRSSAETYYLEVCNDDQVGLKELPDWPEGLSRDIPYTPNFIRYVGRMVGHYFAKTHRGLFAYVENLDKSRQT